MTPALTTPAEVVAIDPESLEVANAFLQCQDLDEVATLFELPKDKVTAILAKPQVKAYVDGVFMNLGFNNRFRMRAALDAIIKSKLEEMMESGISTSKDIIDILALSHKITMGEYEKMIELEKLRQGGKIKNQTNIQINDSGSNYANLLQELLNSGKK